MPKYETYGDYDDEKNTYTGNTEKEVSSSPSAQDVLRDNEEAAAENAPESESKSGSEKEKDGFYKKSTANEANSREAQVSSAQTGILSQVSGMKGKSKGGRFSKRLAPLLFILGITGAGAIGIGFSQVMMPFHVVESLTEMTDASFTARSARMPKLVRWMFNMEGETAYTSEVKSLFGGSSTTRYRRSVKSEKMKTRLKNEGIEVIDSGGNTVLRYTNAGGETVDVEAKDYQKLYRDDADFRNRMNRGGRSFLGRIAAHIDLTLANFLNSHNLTKNLFKNWINKVYDAEGQTVRLHNVIEARSPNTDMKTGAADYDKATERPVDFDADADADTSSLKTNYGDMISNIASVTTSTVCGAAAVASAVTAAKVVIAYENARRAFSGVAESVDKVKAGNGDESPINASADMMMKRDGNGRTMLQSESMKWALSGGTYTPDKNAEDVKSSSIDTIFNESLISGVATSTNFIIGCAIANITTAAVSMVVDIVGNIVTAGAFSVGKLALTATIGASVGIVASVAIDKLTDMLVSNAKTNFCLDASGPTAGACMYLGASKYNGQNFQAGGGSPATKGKAEGFYDQYKIALEDEAELIRSSKSPFDVSTSHTFLGSIVSKLGMITVEMPSLSSMASALTNLASTSIASLMPAASAVDKFSYFSNQLRDDCDNLQFGDVQALGDINCEPVFITDQSINSNKTVGLAEVEGETTAGNVSGTGDPEYIFLVLNKMGSFETKSDGTLVKQDKNGNVTDSEDGVEVIKEDSLLGKYISYCAYRSSPFGHVDQNIMSAESQTTKSSKLGAILNAIPILGDLLQMAEGEKQITTIGWSSGANCVAREDSGETSVINVAALNANEEDSKQNGTFSLEIEGWNDFMRYAQAYVADDRFMETSYEDYISPVQLFAEKQGIVTSGDKLSMVEYLAKYSGYTVENMQIALNEVEYWTYVAQYEPEGKGPVVFEESSEVYDFELPSREIYEDYEEQVAAIRQHVVYADLRNRYSAVA